MTFDPETIDPREVLALTIESAHVTRGFSIGDYLLYVGKRAFNSFKTHGAGVNSIPAHVYRDLGRTLAKHKVIQTTQTGHVTTWNSDDVQPVLEFLFDYLSKLDFAQLPEMERPKEYTVKMLKGDGGPDYIMSALYSRRDAESMLEDRRRRYPENTYELVKVTSA